MATINGRVHETSIWTGKDGLSYLPIAKTLRVGLEVGDPVEVSFVLRLV